ncbi:MAG TPA: helix-turn-helix domain-containing protein [Desulfotomaculum sp.]|nr:MAG: hypothetical protein JL56_03580 [Desulfotomaculum sp. BICA1-6]HBX22494.1 helix-turn-helix domain-containing protein [Desulfotomaculum sp.]
MTIGEKLRNAREENGITLTEVENETKIRRKYIVALENEDFDVLPGKVYVKGFLRNYARFLGVDGDALIVEYEELFPGPAVEPIMEKLTPTNFEKPAKSRRGLLAVVAVLFVGFMIYWWGSAAMLRDDIAGEDQEQNMPAGEDNRGVGSEQDPATGEQNPVVPGIDPAQRGVNVVLQVTDKDCWMQVVVDDSSAFEGLVGPGITKEFRGDNSIWLKLGDAGAVRVSVNGNDYGFLGELGSVVTRTFEIGEDGGNAIGG